MSEYHFPRPFIYDRNAGLVPKTADPVEEEEKV